MARREDASQFGYFGGRGGDSYYGSGGYSNSKVGITTRDGRAPGSGGGGASPQPRSTQGATRDGEGGHGAPGSVILLYFRGPGDLREGSNPGVPPTSPS